MLCGGPGPLARCACSRDRQHWPKRQRGANRQSAEYQVSLVSHHDKQPIANRISEKGEIAAVFALLEEVDIHP